jgi:hypothetical protein
LTLNGRVQSPSAPLINTTTSSRVLHATFPHLWSMVRAPKSSIKKWPCLWGPIQVNPPKSSVVLFTNLALRQLT